jgi:ATP-dependent DNA helicase RecG
MFAENSRTEFKEIYVPEIKKEVVAFANTDGGIIYIGVNDDGKAVGLADVDSVMIQTANALKDGIKPDVMPFVKISETDIEDKKVIKIEVVPGTNKPYYLSDKGLKPSGVYVRKGSSSQPVSDEAIRDIIIQTSGASFENSRSMNQQLTFNYFNEKMKENGLQTGDAQFRTLHLISDDGLYTNLALLLSDQCEHTIKFAVFQGVDKAKFYDRKEFSGSVLKQLDDAFSIINFYNKTHSEINGLNRSDSRDYDEENIREALLNCIVHRDYSFSGSTLISVYDDRIEFVSLGGLVKGLTIEAIFLGVSQSRNPNLASLFYRMKLIESYGTGVGKICRTYQNLERKPVFEAAGGAFRLILPNMSESEESPLSSVDDNYETVIIEYVRKNGSITRSEVEKITGLKVTAAHNALKKMCDENKLKSAGSGRLTRYIIE